MCPTSIPNPLTMPSEIRSKNKAIVNRFFIAFDLQNESQNAQNRAQERWKRGGRADLGPRWLQVAYRTSLFMILEPPRPIFHDFRRFLGVIFGYIFTFVLFLFTYFRHMISSTNAESEHKGAAVCRRQASSIIIKIITRSY